MKYYDEMTSKYGFGDGDSLPPDAFTARAMYVAVINARAKHQGAGCRVFPYNRPGVHNPRMIVYVPARCWDALTPQERRDGSDRYPESVASDQALAEAIAWAHGQRVDELIIASMAIDMERLRALLMQAGGEIAT